MTGGDRQQNAGGTRIAAYEAAAGRMLAEAREVCTNLPPRSVHSC